MNGLATALRTWRDRFDPSSAGVPCAGRRRAPGLRREELAVLAGISVHYLVHLEQGRAETPSAQVCLALARALQLSNDEQAHLLRLARHTHDPDCVPRLIPGSMHRIMNELAGDPLAVFDASWRLLTRNPLHAATFGDPTVGAIGGWNFLLSHFEDWPSRVRLSAEDRVRLEESLVADFRATTGRYPKDPDVSALVERLTRQDRFRTIWERGGVAEHRSAHITVDHPEVGEIALDADTLTMRGSDLRLTVHTPHPGTDARSKLDLLATTETQLTSLLGTSS